MLALRYAISAGPPAPLGNRRHCRPVDRAWQARSAARAISACSLPGDGKRRAGLSAQGAQLLLRGSYAATACRATSTQPLIFSMSGGRPRAARVYPRTSSRTSARRPKARWGRRRRRLAPYISGSDQQLRMRASEPRNVDDELRLVLPVSERLQRRSAGRREDRPDRADYARENPRPYEFQSP